MQKHDLEQNDDLVSLELDQEVNVVAGKYAGRKGKAYYIREEAKYAWRLEIKDGEESFWVDLEDIDFKPTAFRVKLMLSPEERPEFDAVVEGYKTGNS